MVLFVAGNGFNHEHDLVTQVRVEGLGELRRLLRHIGDAGVKKALREANKSASALVVEKALPNVPVRTGRLKRSVRALASQRDARAVAGTASVPYAPPIHWGRVKGGFIKARPFLWNAAQQHQQEAADVYEYEIQKLLDSLR